MRARIGPNIKMPKKETLRTIRRAHWNYINKILLEGLEERDSKPFWRYIKFWKQDSVGIAPIKQGGTLHTDANMKATLLNQQFKSVFTPRDPNNQVPRLDGPSFPSIRPLVISTMGVQKLLCKLNVKKASGPDNISCKILRELSVEIAPVLTYIFQQSLDTGTVPLDWTKAQVTPIFKKGNRHLPENYRAVSLTSVPCKILEHIICSHVRDHLDEYNISTMVQHGFRGGHSCESQLLVTLCVGGIAKSRSTLLSWTLRKPSTLYPMNLS